MNICSFGDDPYLDPDYGSLVNILIITSVLCSMSISGVITFKLVSMSGLGGQLKSLIALVLII